LSKGEIRDALSSARRALENLANETWKQFLKSGDCPLCLSFRRPKTEPDLRNLVEQLRAKARRDDFVHAKKEPIGSSLDALLGIDGQSREWRYLNKGTHEEEDRAEFDLATVQRIIGSLELLDGVLKN
jgi:hypothetical protein